MRRFDPTLLEASLPFARRLARDLAGDEAGADDVLQETCRALLERPPRHTQNLRAYVGLLVRRLAWKRRLREMRLRRREHDVARSERVAPDDERTAREEVQRLALEVVNDLREPYRRTLLLRYLEDLPVPEVALRTGVPLDTARTRVKRGLALLRSELDRRHPLGRRDWLGALLGLARLPRPAPAPFVGAPAALLLAAGLAVLLVPQLSAPGGRAPGAAGESLRVGAATRPALAGPGGLVERAPVARAVDVAPALPGGSPDRIDGRVVGPDGPLAGATVRARAVRIDATLPLGGTRTGADGRFALEVPAWHALREAERASSRITLSVHAPGHHALDELVLDWAALFDAEQVLHLLPGPTLAGRLVRGDGTPARDGLLDLYVLVDGGTEPFRIPHSADEDGRFRLNVPRDARAVTGVAWSMADGFARWTPGGGRGPDDVAEQELGELVLRPLDPLAGRIVFPDGAPLRWTPVWAERVGHDPRRGGPTLAAAPPFDPLRERGLVRGTTSTDEDGRFAFASLAPGTYRISYGIPASSEPDELVREAYPTGTRELVLVRSESRLLVEVVDESGEPVSGVTVAVRELPEEGPGGTPLPCRPPHRAQTREVGYALFSVSAGRTVALHAETAGAVAPEELLLVPTRSFETTCTLRLEDQDSWTAALELDVRGPGGEPVADWTASLSTARGGEPLLVLGGLEPEGTGAGPRLLRGLPGGSYRVHVRPPAGSPSCYLGASLEGVVELSAGRTTRAGIALPEAGRLRLELVGRGTPPDGAARPPAGDGCYGLDLPPRHGPVCLAATFAGRSGRASDAGLAFPAHGLARLDPPCEGRRSGSEAPWVDGWIHPAEPDDLGGLVLRVEPLGPAHGRAPLELTGDALADALRDGLALAPGRYRLVLRSQRFEDAEASVAVHACETELLRLVLARR